jgi:hypothetical protein
MNTYDNLTMFDRLEGFTIGLMALMFPVLTVAVLL